MKDESNTNRKAGSNANLPIDTDEFIRQVSFTGSNENMPKSVQTDVQAEMQNNTSEPTEEKPTKRKRGQAIDYESLFLARNELRDRQGLYISRENYEILQTLVRVIRNERLSVSGLVDNIINQHIELYGEDINRIYDENSRKPIKRNNK
ncbi:MAG: DUF3408 domain-containing protein [Dysgonamonadaceae bacterium]|jgi:hypothetical protein|nr:DUF3408 domain-containing protein [Dysgonamonadaceae bacterium]